MRVSAQGRTQSSFQMGEQTSFPFLYTKTVVRSGILTLAGLMLMCCSKLYIWGIISVRSALCILTPSAFEQYPHNLLSGHSIHQGSTLPRNLTTTSHDGLPMGQSPACQHKRKWNCRTGCYHRKKRKRFTNHGTVRVRLSLTYRVAASVDSWNKTPHKKGQIWSQCSNCTLQQVS